MNSQTGQATLYWGRTTASMVAIDGNSLGAGDTFLLTDSSANIVKVFHIIEDGAT